MNKSIPFYTTLLKSMGMTHVLENKYLYYCIGERTGIAITPAPSSGVFQQGAVGLNHICLAVKSRKVMEEFFNVIVQLCAKIVRKPQQSDFAPGCYSTRFEDPDGIQIEVNFVPGKGLLNE